MEELKVGQMYSGADLARIVFDIKPTTFNKGTKRYLEHLSIFYNWEKVKSKYLITGVTGVEWYPVKKGRKVSRQQTESEYKKMTHEIIEKKPLNTCANIARNIRSDDGYGNPYSHAQSTAENYVRPVLKKDYYIDEKVWCYNDYESNTCVPLDEEQLEFLKGLFISFREKVGEDAINAYADLESNGVEDKEQARELINVVKYSYDKIMNQFAEKYGFRPYKANYYIEELWDKSA